MPLLKPKTALPRPHTQRRSGLRLPAQEGDSAAVLRVATVEYPAPGWLQDWKPAGWGGFLHPTPASGGAEGALNLIKMEWVVPDGSYDNGNYPDAEPVEADFISACDPRPTVTLNSVSASDVQVGAEFATVRLSATVRDPIADNCPRSAGTVENGGADIKEVSVYIDSNATANATFNLANQDDQNNGFWKQHPYKGILQGAAISIPLSEGTRTLRLQTSSNVAGNAGTALAEVTLSKREIPAAPPTGGGSLALNLFIPSDPTPNAADIVRFYYGIREPVPEDALLTEASGAESSLALQGVLPDGSQIEIRVSAVSQGGPWQIPVDGAFVLNDQVQEQIKATVSYLFAGGAVMPLGETVFLETSGNSRVFRSLLQPAGVTGQNFPAAWLANVSIVTQSSQSTFVPTVLRMKGLPDSWNLDQCHIDLNDGGQRLELNRKSDGYVYLKGPSIFVGATVKKNGRYVFIGTINRNNVVSRIEVPIENRSNGAIRAALTKEFVGPIADLGRSVVLVGPLVHDFKTIDGAGRIVISALHDEPENKYHTAAQIEDRKIVITAEAMGKGPGEHIYLRVFDPNDPSPYHENTNNDDNRDAVNGKKGVLAVADGFEEKTDKALFEDGRKVGIVVKAKVEGGKTIAKAVLTITDHCSGDNYIVRAALDKMPDLTKATAQTTLLTAWKRVYIEKDKMFRFGRDLVAESGAGRPDPKKVFLATTTGFAAGDWVRVFDNQENTGELAQVQAAIDVAPKHLLLTVALTKTYRPASFAHVGKVVMSGTSVNDAATFYDVDGRFLKQAYAPAFVEVKFPGDGASWVPYSPGVVPDGPQLGAQQRGLDAMTEFSKRWFKNRQTREDDNPDPADDGTPVGGPALSTVQERVSRETGRPNYFHLVAARWKTPTGGSYGTAWASNNAAYVWVGRMLDAGESRVYIEEVVVHEITHQFDVVRKWEEDGSDAGRALWPLMVPAFSPPHDGEGCIMDYDQDHGNGITRFCMYHVLAGRPGDNVVSIRDGADGK